MRILMVSSLWPPAVLGGAERYAAALADHLRERGHAVGVVTAGTDGAEVVARIGSWGYPMTTYASQPPARRALFHAGDIVRPDAARGLDDAVRRFRPDVVHTHVVQGMSATAMTRAAHHRIGHVHTLHDYWLLCQRTSLVRRDGEACTTRCSSCRMITGLRNVAIARRPPEVVLAVSNAIAKVHTDALDWTRDRTRVLYNPVESFVGPARRPPVPGSVTFGFVGQVSRTKGIETLVRAFTAAAIPGARLVVGGRGPDLDIVGGAGVEARGWLDAAGLDALYAEIDCLVVPSEWQDPAPLVLNEARARGIAVIGAAIGGIPELVAPECAPLLFTARDRSALTGRLQTFAGDPTAFVPAPATAPIDWDDHLDVILAAYDEARTATERGGA